MQTKRKKENKTDEFMLLEYERLHQLWMDENRQAEQRVGFFLSVLTTAGGAIAVLLQISELPVLVVTNSAMIVLSVLLVLGLIFLGRINSRSAQNRSFRKALGEVQDYFASQNSLVADYLEKQRSFYKKGRTYKYRWQLFIGQRLSGTLHDIMIIANSLIVGGIVFIRSGINTSDAIYWTIGSIILSLIVLYLYCAQIIGKLPVWDHY